MKQELLNKLHKYATCKPVSLCIVQSGQKAHFKFFPEADNFKGVRVLHSYS